MRSTLMSAACLCLLASQAHAQQPTEPSEPAPSEQATGDEDPHGVAAMRREELSDAAAMSLFNAASSLFEAGRFLDAAQQFEAAYELSPRPMLLFNAYLAYRDAGRNESAVRSLAAYLEMSPDAPDAERLTNRLAAMRMSAEQDAASEAEAAAERERLAAEAAEARRVAEEERLRAEEAEMNQRSPVGVVVAVAGGAMLVVGVITAILANKRFNNLDESCPTAFCPLDAQVEDNASRVRRLQRTTDAMLFGGAAVVATGVILTFVLKSKPAERDGLAAEPTAACSFNSCEIGVRGSF